MLVLLGTLGWHKFSRMKKLPAFEVPCRFLRYTARFLHFLLGRRFRSLIAKGLLNIVDKGKRDTMRLIEALVAFAASLKYYELICYFFIATVLYVSFRRHFFVLCGSRDVGGAWLTETTVCDSLHISRHASPSCKVSWAPPSENHRLAARDPLL